MRGKKEGHVKGKECELWTQIKPSSRPNETLEEGEGNQAACRMYYYEVTLPLPLLRLATPLSPIPKDTAERKRETPIYYHVGYKSDNIVRPSTDPVQQLKGR
jgi:hypothetical protein